jgi:hypothetical protein
MGGVSPETCWASCKYKIKIFIHSCILLYFLCELYYDARIHEHQVVILFSQAFERTLSSPHLHTSFSVLFISQHCWAANATLHKDRNYLFCISLNSLRIKLFRPALRSKKLCPLPLTYYQWLDGVGFWQTLVWEFFKTTCWAGMSFVTIDSMKPILYVRKTAPLYRHWGSVQAVRPIGGEEV